jgi:Fuc2NAc and GlcNAc transferase
MEPTDASSILWQALSMALVMGGAVALLTFPVHGLMARAGVLAHPGHRASHAAAKPVGGGLAFVVPTSVSWFVLGMASSETALAAIALAGLGLAAVGLADDCKGLPAAPRLAAQVGAALIVAGIVMHDLGPWASIAPLAVLSALAITWATNLFNFMDGLDGLATSEGLFIAAAGCGLWIWQGGDPTIALALAGLAGALLGFLPWNAPEARIFMGDTGSTWLGFVLSSLALHATVEAPHTWPVWLILPAIFVADATVCVVRRALRRERLAEAHRAHAYQNLARAVGSHGTVVLALAGGNACLLWAAIAALRDPDRAVAIVAAVVTATVAVMVAGRSGVHGVAESA